MTGYMGQYVGEQFGNYRLIHLLGRGGYAEVYLAEDLDQRTKVAIKVFNRRHTEADNVQEVLNEVRISRLRHPNIVQVRDFGVNKDGLYFLVMNYAPNGNLRQRHPRGTRMPLETIVTYVRQIAAALQYAHNEKMIHRDIKPENMLVGYNDEILLGDFGIAVVAHSTNSQVMETPIGTISYIAPEQIRGKPVPASDQYSLGIVVYEWLCGIPPFYGTNEEVYSQHLFTPPPSLRERMREIHPHIEHVVTKSLLKDPHKRFPGVQAFASELERVYVSIQPKIIGDIIYQPQPPLILAAPSSNQQVPRPHPLPHKGASSPPVRPLRQKEAAVQKVQPLVQPPPAKIQKSPTPSAKLSPQSGVVSKKSSLQQETQADRLYRYTCIAIISIDLSIGTLWFVGQQPLFWPIFLIWGIVMLALDVRGLFFVHSREQAISVAFMASMSWFINILLIELMSSWNGTLFVIGVTAAVVCFPTHLYLAHPLKNYSYKGLEVCEDTPISI